MRFDLLIGLSDSVRLKTTAQLEQQFQVICNHITKRVRFNDKLTILQPYLWKLFLVNWEIEKHDEERKGEGGQLFVVTSYGFTLGSTYCHWTIL